MGPVSGSTWAVTGISEPLRSLLSLTSFYVVLMVATLVAYWGGVLTLRIAGKAARFSLVPLGFRRPKDGVLVGTLVGFAVGIAAIFAGAVVNLLSMVVLRSLGYPVESGVQQQIIPQLAGWISEAPALAIPATILAVVIIGPFVEELLFRGAIFNGLYQLGRSFSARRDRAENLAAPGEEIPDEETAEGDAPGKSKNGDKKSREMIPFIVAAVLSSAFFALLHLEPVLLPALLLLAVALCFLFRWSGSLLPPFVAHATFNSFTTVLVILSGLGLFEIPV